MIRNHFKIAFRNLWKNKGYSAINIFGLAIGLTVCLLITLFVMDELSYDRYNEKAGRIYRVNTYIHLNGSDFKQRLTPAPMATALMKDYPQIEQATRVGTGSEMLVKKDNETIVEKNAFSADPNLFEVFSLPMIAGDPKTALSQPKTMVISASIAKKYFNTIDVIGKTLKVDNTTFYKITGVIKDMPAAAHLHFNFIKSFVGNEFANNPVWLNNSFVTYLLVRPGTSQQSIDNYLKDAAKKYVEPQVQTFFHSNFNDLAKKGDFLRYQTIPLTRIHLYSDLTNEAEPSGNIQYVYIFIVVAVFILLLACVNFMNLSTARSAGRSKEVGVRKVLGSDKATLVTQFLTESVLTGLLAMVIALFIAMLFLPYFNQLAGKETGLSLFSSGWTLPALLLITVFIGILAGLYPAFFLSAFQPITVLKGKMSTGFKGSWLRNTLVVFQFSTAIILIIGTLVIYNQLNYIRNKNLGYNREQVLVLKNIYSLGNYAQIFKNEVLQIPGVISGARASALPTSSEQNFNQNAFSKDASMSAAETVTLADWSVDTDYIPTLGMQMAAGRNFSAQMPTDSNSLIINETAARLLGYKNPLQEKLYDSNQNNTTNTRQIIGVVKDFNTGSLRNKTLPVVFRLSKYADTFAFRIKSNNMPQVIGQIEAKYHGVVKEMEGQPFTYSFMDEDFDHLYQSEQRTGKLFITFAFFAILIACLGLFGLITYAAEQRTKEIGIRKVLGATVTNVTAMLSKDFIKLVFIAIIIAVPIAWFAMNKWLQSFAYRTNISWWVFALAAGMAVFIALATISFQAVKAALANPVKSLRSE
ncbi:ABC transporter permease [uncultured Mucilaginibacter sp.]|uniref:ABC transporter permease n=1 Tax=uncultured Mucilaginibacter sp. TaxID=797541 RepID=UPI002607703E|nr:ABC transporter permease [uncultured Mucilaginibacter sp.]